MKKAKRRWKNSLGEENAKQRYRDVNNCIFSRDTEYVNVIVVDECGQHKVKYKAGCVDQELK